MRPAPNHVEGPLPRYALAGVIVMCLSEVLLLLQVEPFWTWHTAIAWSGYILLADGIVWMRRGESWLMNARREFVFLGVLSIPLWLVFEFYNLFIENWYYVNLPEHRALRLLGFGWSFATIWPAILISADMIGSLRTASQTLGNVRGNEAANKIRSVSDGSAWGWGPTRIKKSPQPFDFILIATGAAMLLWPLLFPSPYLAAPVWLGFILVLDPINAALGEQSLLGDLRHGRRDRLINLTLSGFLCGILWEFWNYWARAKWIYTVPIMEEVRIFEMPLPGYLGFPAFALECFTMYVFVRRLVWRGPKRIVAL